MGRSKHPRGPLKLRRMTCVYTSRDISKDKLEERTVAHIQSLRPGDFDQQMKLHQDKWAKFWDSTDINFGINRSVTEAQRFNGVEII